MRSLSEMARQLATRPRDPIVAETVRRACVDRLTHAPDDARSWHVLGSAKARLGDTPVPAFRRSLCLDPSEWRTLGALAVVTEGRTRTPYLERGLCCAPDAPDLWDALGQTLASVEQPGRESIDRRSVLLAPERVGPLTRLARRLRDQGWFENGLRLVDWASVLVPNRNWAWVRVATAQPALFGTMADRDASVLAVEGAVRALASSPAFQEDVSSVLGLPRLFHHAYAGVDDTETIRALGMATTRIAAERASASSVASAVPARSRNAPPVAVIFGFNARHAAWRPIGRWWAEWLRGAGIETCYYDIHGAASPLDPSLFAKVVSGPKDVDDWRRNILEAGHEVILYPEIGMDPVTRFLANHRLAPVQVAGWGHPTTTGLPTIDFYLSAERFEPAGSERFYSETMVRLPGVAGPIDFAGAGHPSGERLVDGGPPPTAILAQSVRKYLPDFDDVVADIAIGAPDSRIIVMKSGTRDEVDLFRARFERAFRARGLDPSGRIDWRDLMPREDFRSFLGSCSVYLDPPSFSGFNTASMALSVNLPVITRLGGRLRECLAAGLLKEIGVHDTVVSDMSTYRRLAIDALNNEAVRGGLSDSIANARARYVDGADARKAFIAFINKVI